MRGGQIQPDVLVSFSCSQSVCSCSFEFVCLPFSPTCTLVLPPPLFSQQLEHLCVHSPAAARWHFGPGGCPARQPEPAGKHSSHMFLLQGFKRLSAQSEMELTSGKVVSCPFFWTLSGCKYCGLRLSSLHICIQPGIFGKLQEQWHLYLYTYLYKYTYFILYCIHFSLWLFKTTGLQIKPSSTECFGLIGWPLLLGRAIQTWPSERS